MNLQLAEEVLYDLPPLEGVFLHWHTHGVTATTPGITSLLSRREQMLGAATLSGASIRLLYECAADCLHRLSVPVSSPWERRPLHARLLRHGPSQRAAETQALLPPGVLVQKTVSINRLLGRPAKQAVEWHTRRNLTQHISRLRARLWPFDLDILCLTGYGYLLLARSHEQVTGA
jgi:hypothetical protein